MCVVINIKTLSRANLSIKQIKILSRPFRTSSRIWSQPQQSPSPSLTREHDDSHPSLSDFSLLSSHWIEYNTLSLRAREHISRIVLPFFISFFLHSLSSSSIDSLFLYLFFLKLSLIVFVEFFFAVISVEFRC